MDRIQGKIMNKKDFLEDIPYTKEPYEGILVSADTKHNLYKIAVQLGENQVLVVDQVSDRDVQERVREWVPRVNDIQMQYGVINDPENYS